MKIIPVEFPNGGAKAAAISNHDGSFKIYVNELFPEAERMAVVRELVQQMG